MTSRQITQAYLTRISDIDKKLNSIIELNPDALAIADQMDAERKAGKIRGPLHGIPIAIKDNIDTADKMKTTAGSLALVDAPTPKQDAFIVRQLRAGGRRHHRQNKPQRMGEFPLHQIVQRLVWPRRADPQSRIFSTATRAARRRAPARQLPRIWSRSESAPKPTARSFARLATCGIVGIKPTLGLVSRSGIIPIAHSQDTAGPMTRTVADSAILLGALVGTDRSDPITSRANSGGNDYTKYLTKRRAPGHEARVWRASTSAATQS